MEQHYVEKAMAVYTATRPRENPDVGRRLGIPFGSNEATCPVRAVQAWLKTARIVDGPVFSAGGPPLSTGSQRGYRPSGWR